MRDYLVFAVDFDGTITLNEDNYPECGRPNDLFIWSLKHVQNKGHKLILYTLREGDNLQKAIEFCARHGLIFNAVNDNLPEQIELWDSNPRKIAADHYIDNRNMTAEQFIEWMKRN